MGLELVDLDWWSLLDATSVTFTAASVYFANKRLALRRAHEVIMARYGS